MKLIKSPCFKSTIDDGPLLNSHAKPSIVKQRTRHVKLTKEEQAALDSDLDEFFGRPLSQLSQTELYDAFHHYKSKGEKELRDEDEASAERYRRLMLGIANYGCTNRAEWLFGNLSFELTRPTIVETKHGGRSGPEVVGSDDTPGVAKDNREGDNESSAVRAAASSSLYGLNAPTHGKEIRKSCATLAMQKVGFQNGQQSHKWLTGNL